MPFSGYTSQELCVLMRRSRQALFVSGVLDRLPKSYPFGKRTNTPLYNIEAVDQLSVRVARYDAAVYFGNAGKRISPLRTPLEDPTWNDDSLDTICPECGANAVKKSQDASEIWCPVCIPGTTGAIGVQTVFINPYNDHELVVLMKDRSILQYIVAGQEFLEGIKPASWLIAGAVLFKGSMAGRETSKYLEMRAARLGIEPSPVVQNLLRQLDDVSGTPDASSSHPEDRQAMPPEILVGIQACMQTHVFLSNAQLKEIAKRE